MVVKDKIINIIRDSLKNSIFRVGGGGGGVNKRMRLGEFVDLRGGWCF